MRVAYRGARIFTECVGPDARVGADEGARLPKICSWPLMSGRVGGWAHRSEAPRECLQCGDREAIPGLTIRKSVACLRAGVLRIDHFEHCRFPGLVTHGGEAKALVGEFCGLMQRVQLGARNFSFIVELAQVAQRLALSEAQLNASLIATQSGLLQLASVCAPVPDGNLDAGHDRGAQVIYELSSDRIKLTGREAAGVNPIEVVHGCGGH